VTVRGRIEVDVEREPAVLSAAVLNEVFAHALEAVPEECCGLITGDERVRYRQVVRCRNDMTLHHRRDPANFPRSGAKGFHMNEVDYLQAQRDAEARGEQVNCVYHSHVGSGAYFSPMDQEFAAQSVFPFPAADHLVVSVVGGKVIDQALFERCGEPSPGDDAPAPFAGRSVVHGPA